MLMQQVADKTYLQDEDQWKTIGGGEQREKAVQVAQEKKGKRGGDEVVIRRVEQ